MWCGCIGAESWFGMGRGRIANPPERGQVRLARFPVFPFSAQQSNNAVPFNHELYQQSLVWRVGAGHYRLCHKWVLIMSIEEELRAAVKIARIQRSKFYGALGVADEQKFGQPATETEIAAITELLAPIPPSYLAFLRIFNGWRMFDGDIDLVSAAKIPALNSKKWLAEWKNEVAEDESIDTSGWILISNSPASAGKYFLDANDIRKNGEFSVVEHEDILTGRYENIIYLLTETLGQYSEPIDPNVYGGSLDLKGLEDI